MKKIFAFCLAALMLLSLATCGQDVPKNDEAGSNSSQQLGGPSMSGNPENEGNPDIAPEDDPSAKSSQQSAEEGQANLPEGNEKNDAGSSDTASGGAKQRGGDSKGVPENATGAPDIAPEDDPNAGANQQVAQQFLVDLPEDDGSGLGDMADTASYAGAAAEKKVP